MFPKLVLLDKKVILWYNIGTLQKGETMGTLHDYILKTMNESESEWQSMKEANRSWCGHDEAHLKNMWYAREASDEEKTAIKHYVDLEIKGMQKALKDAGEKPLSIKAVRRFWKSRYEEELVTGDLPKMKKWHKRVTEHPYPHLAEQFLVQEVADRCTNGWKRCARPAPIHPNDGNGGRG